MARPTEYKTAFIQKAVQYLKEFAKKDFEDYKGEIIPTIEGFTRYIEVGSKQTLHNWAKEHDEFLDALEAIKTAQGILLQNKGLKGEYNATIAKLMLSANHGMVERREDKLEHSGSVGLGDVLKKADDSDSKSEG